MTRLSSVKVSPEYARELSSLFTTATLRALAAPEPWEAMSRFAIFGDARLSGTIGELVDDAFASLRSTRRSEYVFKNDVVSRLIFGRHKPTTASAALEFGIRNSKADVVVVNGTTTVYEMKTDYDSFARLESQLSDYSEFAEHVYVVVSPDRSRAALCAAPRHVGVVSLSPSGRMSTVRAAEGGLSRLTSASLFQALRSSERALVLEAEGEDHDGSTAGMREAFSRVSVVSLHGHTVRLLRQRFGAAANVVTDPRFPYSLRALAYGVPLSGSARSRLLRRLQSSPMSLG